MLMFMHVTNMNGMYLKWYVVWYILFMRPPKHKQKAFGSILLRLVSFGMLNTFEYSRYSIQNNAQQKNRWSLWIFAMFFLQERRTIGGFIAPMPCQQTTCKCKILFATVLVLGAATPPPFLSLYYTRSLSRQKVSFFQLFSSSTARNARNDEEQYRESLL